ncbi:hypothetical protein AAF712_004533 [Marasmius tenuissimus]|uniref:Uncharacterized protein n=1 Tax=Marasmius tenuissimus TaxID=585030 RepID=A0ABR3A4I3_9AGAR
MVHLVMVHRAATAKEVAKVVKGVAKAPREEDRPAGMTTKVAREERIRAATTVAKQQGNGQPGQQQGNQPSGSGGVDQGGQQGNGPQSSQNDGENGSSSATTSLSSTSGQWQGGQNAPTTIPVSPSEVPERHNDAHPDLTTNHGSPTFDTAATIRVASLLPTAVIDVSSYGSTTELATLLHTTTVSTDLPSFTPSPSTASSNSHNGTHTGVIVGDVVVLAILILVALWMLRRRRRRALSRRVVHNNPHDTLIMTESRCSSRAAPSIDFDPTAMIVQPPPQRFSSVRSMLSRKLRRA